MKLTFDANTNVLNKNKSRQWTCFIRSLSQKQKRLWKASQHLSHIARRSLLYGNDTPQTRSQGKESWRKKKELLETLTRIQKQHWDAARLAEIKASEAIGKYLVALLDVWTKTHQPSTCSYLKEFRSLLVDSYGLRRHYAPRTPQ